MSHSRLSVKTLQFTLYSQVRDFSSSPLYFIFVKFCIPLLKIVTSLPVLILILPVLEKILGGGKFVKMFGSEIFVRYYNPDYTPLTAFKTFSKGKSLYKLV